MEVRGLLVTERSALSQKAAIGLLLFAVLSAAYDKIKKK